MLMENDPELQPIIGDQQSRIFNSDRVCNCLRNFKWILFLTAILYQFVGLTMVTIWAVDCFFREFRTTANCEQFDLFPMPHLFECFWLLTSSAGYVFLIYHVVYYSPAFCGTRKVSRHLVKKKYFYKVSFVLLVVVTYNVYVISNDPKSWKFLSYISFITEEILTVVLVFFLNFLRRFWIGGQPSIKRWLYKAALVLYVLQNILAALLGSTVAAYKVLTVSESEPKKNVKPGPKAVVGLMMLITTNGYRYFVAEFFFSKLFDEELNILGGNTIEESIGNLDPEN